MIDLLFRDEEDLLFKDKDNNDLIIMDHDGPLICKDNNVLRIMDCNKPLI